MNARKFFAVLAAAAFLPLAGFAADKTPAELEKEKAMANPYPNDFGPGTLDDATLKSYPAEIQAGYKVMLVKCAQCHQPSRPLNSRFVEPSVGWNLKGEDRDKKEAAAIEAMKKEHADWFADKQTWQIEAGVWSRYVKRMMSKPGCKISPDEGKKIYQFLVYDGERRKLGENAAKWKAHRAKLVDELKTKKAARYEELKKDNDL